MDHTCDQIDNTTGETTAESLKRMEQKIADKMSMKFFL